MKNTLRYVPIRPDVLYGETKDKIKINWFCYEISRNINIIFVKVLGNKLAKMNITSKEVNELSIFLSYKIKDIILEYNEGKIPLIYFNYEIINSYQLKLNVQLVNTMVALVKEIIKEQMNYCLLCPHRCIDNPDEYFYMFDDKKCYLD